ncbi:hypothetical protein [Methanobrevibacter sp.]|uniref:hypothetical protein n=1 Tax=Methanobrevibacter sp. TaxID=66852 RepID=UPI00388E3A8F
MSTNVISATDSNDTVSDNILSQNFDDNYEVIEVSSDSELGHEDTNIILTNSSNENIVFDEMYVGQNTTEDGGNGSYENPFATLKLACDNINDGDNVTLNIFNGTYLVDSLLTFKSSNLIINGWGNVVIKNGNPNKPTDYQALSLSFSSNLTINNVVFDQSGVSQNVGRRFYPVYMDPKNTLNATVIYNNCTFMGSTHAQLTGASEFNLKLIKCIIKNYGHGSSSFLFTRNFFNGDRAKSTNYRYVYFENCIFLNNTLTRIAQLMVENKNVSMNGAWFGENNIPDYLLGIGGRNTKEKSIDPIDMPITKYAIFSAQEYYLGNNQYEIIGKLCWNGTNDTVGNSFAPMIVTLTSSTGDIVNSTTLENGTFRVIYTSNSSENKVTATLDYQPIDLIFTNLDIQVDSPSVFYGDNQNILVTLPQATNATVNITVNNKTYEVKVNGSDSVTFNVPEVLKEGTYIVDVLLVDADNHIYGSNSTELVVSKVSDYTFAPIVPSDAKVDDTVTINVELPSDATGTVIVSVGDKNFSADASANVEINITGLVAGDNNIIVTYSGDDKYVNKSSESILTAEKVELDMTNETLNVETPEGTVNPEFSIALPNDATGNLTVIVNNKTYTQELVNGSAKITVDDLTPGDHNATVTYTGDDKYDAITTTTNLTVPKVDVPINNNTLVTDTPKGTTTPEFSINLPNDATGNLTVTINGKNYTQELVNGSAKVTIPNLTPGDYNATITYSGDDKYDPIVSNTTVSVPKPVLTAKNISMLYTSGTKYTVQVKVDGKAVTGKTVNFVINGKKTIAKTNNKGYASVKITLPPKSKAYTVTASYLGVKVTNKVTVKSIVVAKNLKAKKSAKTLKIKVTLKKVNKKYLKGKKVTLKFKGKTYKVKTNKKGVVTFTIKKNVLNKLKVGKKYTYKVTYGKDTVNKKITIKK